jgi:pyruvate/2-oxoglutarate/acetoin dehydrogenase E1 component
VLRDHVETLESRVKRTNGSDAEHSDAANAHIAGLKVLMPYWKYDALRNAARDLVIAFEMKRRRGFEPLFGPWATP